MPYADLVILALVAVFILLRLRNVLGRSDGQDYSNFFKPPATPPAAGQSPVVMPQAQERFLKNKTKEEPAQDPYIASLPPGMVATGLSDIKAKDPLFVVADFLRGAQSAFEMVFDAFAKGDKNMLKMLLSDEIFAQFSAEIDAREKSERKNDSTLVSAKTKEITAATLDGSVARIAVKFASEQVTLVRDGSGSIVEGNPSEVFPVDDEWLFERDVSSKSPNWKIIET